MTTVSAMFQSPCSDCSRTSSRSDWFRQSILFWSSQSERSAEKCTNDRYCRCHSSHGRHRAESLGSSHISYSPVAERKRSPNKLTTNYLKSPTTTPVIPPKFANHVKEKEKCEIKAKKSEKAHSIDEKANWATMEEIKICTKAEDTVPKDNEYDPSELLKQVKELERCFEKKTKQDAPQRREVTLLSNEPLSPHMTLEFPKGSHIKESPLYGSESTNQEAESSAENIPVNVEVCEVEDEQKNEATSEVLESIQEVQNCLSEITKELELSKTTRKNTPTIYSEASATKHLPRQTEFLKENRDPNSVMKDWLSNIKPPPTPNDNQDILPNKSKADNRSDIISDGENTRVKNISPNKSKSKTNKGSKNRIDIIGDDHTINTDELLQRIDELMRFEDKDNGSLSTRSTIERLMSSDSGKISNNNNVHYERDRFDSGLQSTSSDSNSPYPSPSVSRALESGLKSNNRRHSYCTEGIKAPEVIHEVANEKLVDSVFKDDSDFSDCSPISTLDSALGGSMNSGYHRIRSQSIPCTGGELVKVHNGIKYLENTSDFKADDKGKLIIDRLKSLTRDQEDADELATTPIDEPQKELAQPRSHTPKEEETVKKYLELTEEHRRSSSKLDAICWDNLALLPSIKDAIEEQRKELGVQQQKQERFLHQLGDLLLEVVSLKEEHTTVRTKQTKALNIMKKQLDACKKSQSQAHSDLTNKVNELNEKINSTLCYTAEQISNSPSLRTQTSFNFNDTTSSVTSTSASYLQKGHIIWRISDVMKRLTKIKSGSVDGTLVSAPFLTSEYGYKMNAWLYLNGRGRMSGNYLSLYVCVAVGDYDPILTWPIRPSYTMTLMDQQNDSTRRQDFVKVRRVSDIANRGGNVIAQYGGIPRPSDSTKALIVGLDDFISHEELLSRRYLVDDVMFLKIEAEV